LVSGGGGGGNGTGTPSHQRISVKAAVVRQRIDTAAISNQ
jgi:hypothetical protein